MLRRWLWFIALWSLSVCALGLIAMAIRAVLLP